MPVDEAGKPRWTEHEEQALIIARHNYPSIQIIYDATPELHCFTMEHIQDRLEKLMARGLVPSSWGPRVTRSPGAYASALGKPRRRSRLSIENGELNESHFETSSNKSLDGSSSSTETMTSKSRSSLDPTTTTTTELKKPSPSSQLATMKRPWLSKSKLPPSHAPTTHHEGLVKRRPGRPKKSTTATNNDHHTDMKPPRHGHHQNSDPLVNSADSHGKSGKIPVKLGRRYSKGIYNGQSGEQSLKVTEDGTGFIPKMSPVNWTESPNTPEKLPTVPAKFEFRHEPVYVDSTISPVIKFLVAKLITPNNKVVMDEPELPWVKPEVFKRKLKGQEDETLLEPLLPLNAPVEYQRICLQRLPSELAGHVAKSASKLLGVPAEELLDFSSCQQVTQIETSSESLRHDDLIQSQLNPPEGSPRAHRKKKKRRRLLSMSPKQSRKARRGVYRRRGSKVSALSSQNSVDDGGDADDDENVYHSAEEESGEEQGEFDEETGEFDESQDVEESMEAGEEDSQHLKIHGSFGSEILRTRSRASEDAQDEQVNVDGYDDTHSFEQPMSSGQLNSSGTMLNTSGEQLLQVKGYLLKVKGYRSPEVSSNETQLHKTAHTHSVHVGDRMDVVETPSTHGERASTHDEKHSTRNDPSANGNHVMDNNVEKSTQNATSSVNTTSNTVDSLDLALAAAAEALASAKKTPRKAPVRLVSSASSDGSPPPSITSSAPSPSLTNGTSASSVNNTLETSRTAPIHLGKATSTTPASIRKPTSSTAPIPSTSTPIGSTPTQQNAVMTSPTNPLSTATNPKKRGRPPSTPLGSAATTSNNSHLASVSTAPPAAKRAKTGSSPSPAIQFGNAVPSSMLQQNHHSSTSMVQNEADNDEIIPSNIFSLTEESHLEYDLIGPGSVNPFVKVLSYPEFAVIIGPFHEKSVVSDYYVLDAHSIVFSVTIDAPPPPGFSPALARAWSSNYPTNYKFVTHFPSGINTETRFADVTYMDGFTIYNWGAIKECPPYCRHLPCPKANTALAPGQHCPITHCEMLQHGGHLFTPTEARLSSNSNSRSGK